jgi:hypothetical protein
MSQAPEELEAPRPPQGHIRIVYLGPVAPHWEVQSEFGDRSVIEEFRQRALARLLLLPPHDPQFRRNRERVARDAEREALILEWDLGIPEDDEAQPAPTEEQGEQAQEQGQEQGQEKGQEESG